MSQLLNLRPCNGQTLKLSVLDADIAVASIRLYCTRIPVGSSAGGDGDHQDHGGEGPSPDGTISGLTGLLAGSGI